MPGRGSRWHLLGSAGTGLLIVGVCALILPHGGWAVGLLAALPVIAWRHDNDVGAFFPLAVALVLIVLILSLFLLMMAIVL